MGSVAFEATEEPGCTVAYTVSATTTVTWEGYSEVGIEEDEVTVTELDSGE